MDEKSISTTAPACGERMQINTSLQPPEVATPGMRLPAGADDPSLKSRAELENRALVGKLNALERRNRELEAELAAERRKSRRYIEEAAKSHQVVSSPAAVRIAAAISEMRSVAGTTALSRMDGIENEIAVFVEGWCRTTCRELEAAIEQANVSRILSLDALVAAHPCEDRKPTPNTIKL